MENRRELRSWKSAQGGSKLVKVRRAIKHEARMFSPPPGSSISNALLLSDGWWVSIRARESEWQRQATGHRRTFQACRVQGLLPRPSSSSGRAPGPFWGLILSQVSGPLSPLPPPPAHLPPRDGLR